MHPQKIVIIDDEHLIRMTTSMLLKHNGFEVLTAANGEEGLAVIREQKPDILLLDIMMPGMDGWEVLRKLREKEDTVSLFVIIFTACDLPIPDEIAEMERHISILKKPFHLQELLNLINRKGPEHG